MLCFFPPVICGGILFDRVVQYAKMTKSFKHKGLEKYYSTGSLKDIQAKQSNKIHMQLAALDSAQNIDDIDIPGYRLH